MTRFCIVATLGLCAVGSPISAQLVPWDTFADNISNSVCSVVNAGNTELVVLRTTGQLVIVTGTDVLLEDAFVDAQGFVTFEGEDAGLLDFAIDGDGFRTLWWLTLTGNVVEVSGFTGEPRETDLFPDDFVDVPCDACDFWDDPTVCGDPDPPVLNLCGVGVPLSASASFMGLMGFRGLRRRRVNRPHGIE